GSVLAEGPQPADPQVGGCGDERGDEGHFGTAHDADGWAAQVLVGFGFDVGESRLGIGAAAHRLVPGVGSDRMLLVEATHIAHCAGEGVWVVEVDGDGGLAADVALGAGGGDVGGDDDAVLGGDTQRGGFEGAGDPAGGGGALVADGAIRTRCGSEAAEGVALPFGDQLLVVVDVLDGCADGWGVE